MRLLFIKLKHIGDSLILTPTLAAVRQAYPQALIWVVVRRSCEGILAGCPALDRVLTAPAPERERRSWGDLAKTWSLIRTLRQLRFDWAFELSGGDRGRLLAWLSGARQRCTNVAAHPLSRWWRGRFQAQSRFAWQERHQVEKDYGTVSEFLPLPAAIPPLVFARERTVPWRPAAPLDPFVVLHPGTRWVRKQWPTDRWIQVAQTLASFGFQVIVSAGPDPAEIQLAGRIAAAVGPAALSTQGSLSWAQLAGLLYRARLFVGVDTAAMHLAAACQCPTVALFGPSLPSAWRPWQTPHRLLAPSPELQARLPATEQTHAITIAEVLIACQELLDAPASRELGQNPR